MCKESVFHRVFTETKRNKGNLNKYAELELELQNCAAAKSALEYTGNAGSIPDPDTLPVSNTPRSDTRQYPPQSEVLRNIL